MPAWLRLTQLLRPRTQQAGMRAGCLTQRAPLQPSTGYNGKVRGDIDHRAYMPGGRPGQP